MSVRPSTHWDHRGVRLSRSHLTPSIPSKANPPACSYFRQVFTLRRVHDLVPPPIFSSFFVIIVHGMQPLVSAMATFRKTFLAAIIKSLLRGKSLVQAILAYWIRPVKLGTDGKPRVGTTSRRTIQEFLKEAEALLLGPVDRDGLQQLSRDLREQLLDRLQTDMQCMLPSYSHQLPRGTECGRFLALDVGGSTLRVALVELRGRTADVGEESKIISIQNYYIGPEIKALEGMAFFDWMAERILETLSAELEEHRSPDHPLPMSMAWSFPIE